MKKKAARLASAVVPLLAGLVIAASSNAQSAMSDEAYCRALVKELTHGGIERGFAPESLDTSVAINQCLDGNPRPAIPVLERKLIGNDFDVPPRNSVPRKSGAASCAVSASARGRRSRPRSSASGATATPLPCRPVRCAYTAWPCRSAARTACSAAFPRSLTKLATAIAADLAVKRGDGWPPIGAVP